LKVIIFLNFNLFCNLLILFPYFSGVICPHRGAVFSYHWRHEVYPFIKEEKVACNIFFPWEMLRPLLKGKKKSWLFIRRKQNLSIHCIVNNWGESI